MSVLCAPRGATNPIHQAWSPKSKAPHVWAWVGLRVPGTGPLAVGLQAALAVEWGSPQPPHLLVLPPTHLHVNLYI